jgi:hypothetical protein
VKSAGSAEASVSGCDVTSRYDSEPSRREGASENPHAGLPGCGVEFAWVPAPPSRPARIEPLAPARYKVQFTASAQLREKLERLRTLMRNELARAGCG